MKGTSLGPYRIEAELGSGAMGSVWLASVQGDSAAVPRDERVAVKVIHPHLLSRPGMFKRFLREADAGRRVRHENVVATLDADALEVDGRTCHFLVMEYVEGGRTLRDLLGDLSLVPEALVREVARQLADGLAAIHEAGIVHRDLKPENVLLTTDDQVRIMDLGVARLVEESVALTREGTFTGSLPYASPEQFGAGEVGPASDLYGMGVVLYELVTGANPFRRENAARIAAAHLRETPARADAVGSEASPFLAELLACLLEKDPADRVDSAAALAGILEEGESSEWWAERARVAIEAPSGIPRVPVRRETEVYGREEELALLREAWRRAESGEGAVLLLRGETGIGKTRLVDSFLAGIPDGEVHALYGSYPPSGGAGALTDAVLELLGSRDLDGALLEYLPAVPRLVPAFSAMLRHMAPPAGAEMLGNDAVHAVFCHLLRGLAEERPLLWVIEDLHFAEPESRAIVLAMARAVEGRRAMLLLTSRPGLPEEDQANLARLPDFRRVDPGRLGEREVFRLLLDAFRSDRLAERLGPRIARKSDGVPFFVFEMIRTLREGRQLEERPDGTWVESSVIDEIEVPSTIRDLVAARLAGLSKEEREILDVAAVSGYVFDPGLAARVLERRPIGVLRDLAEIERRTGVVRAAGRSFRFDHHQIQEVVYAELPESLRAEYHAAVADELAGDDPDGLKGAAAVEFVHHHLSGSRPRRAVPLLEPVIEYLENEHRLRVVRELSDRALAVPSLLSGVDRAKALLSRANATTSWEERQRAKDEALAIAEQTGDPGIRSRALRAKAQEQEIDPQEAWSLLEEAVRLAKEAGDRKGEGLCESARAQWDHMADRAEDAIRRLERAIRIFREIDDADLEVDAVQTLGMVYAGAGRTEKARMVLEEALTLCRSAGASRMEAHTTLTIGSLFHGDGHLQEALRHCRRSHRIAKAHGHTSIGPQVNLHLGILLRRLGDGARSREHLGRLIELARELGSRGYEAVGKVHLALTEQYEGNLDTAEALCREGVAIYEEGRYPYAVGFGRDILATILVDAGRKEEAVEQFRRVVAIYADLDQPAVDPLAWLAWLDDEPPDRAIAAMKSVEHRAGRAGLISPKYHLYRATGDVGLLEEAYRRVAHLRDHAPEEYRESMIENVPIHREIFAAWEAARKGEEASD